MAVGTEPLILEATTYQPAARHVAVELSQATRGGGGLQRPSQPGMGPETGAAPPGPGGSACSAATESDAASRGAYALMPDDPSRSRRASDRRRATGVRVISDVKSGRHDARDSRHVRRQTSDVTSDVSP